MNELHGIELVFAEVLKNNPFTKEEQINLFCKLAISNQESLDKNEYPLDDFYEWWVEVGEQIATDKFINNIKSENDETELESYLISEEVDEWHKSNWILYYVFDRIPH